jgi:hypothetical protein
MPRVDRWSLVFALLLVVAIICSAPHSVRDPDVLSRLAMGRYLAQHGSFPAHDLWTFSAPSVPFGDPEWLGDLLWYALFSRFSETGLQVAAVTLASIGYLLALRFGIACGGDVRSLVPLQLCTLSVAAPRMNARNDLHLLWLFPLLCLLLLRARERASCWFYVIALLWCWANIHSSFVVAALPILAVAFEQRGKSAWPWLVLGTLPALPFVGLSGASPYHQIFDHLVGAGMYRTWLSEWRTPLTSGAWLAILPLHLSCVLGIYGFYAVRAVPHVPLRGAMFVLGCALAYSSRRFLPLTAALIVPAIAPELKVLAERISAPRRLAALSGALLVYLALIARTLMHNDRSSVFERNDRLQEALSFIAQRAPASRTFNSYDDGPWLLWFGDARLQHYIDPRNNLGHGMLERYVKVSRDPTAFEAEAERLDMSTALIPYRDASLRPLAFALSRSKRWTLVYWNGWQALFARRTPTNRHLIAQFGYKTLRPTLDLRYLSSEQEAASDVEHDLSLLHAQAPTLASIVRAYRQLRDASTPGGRVAAARIIEAAWPTVPDTDSLSNALQALAAQLPK